MPLDKWLSLSIYDDETICVFHRKGNSGTAVVCFSGIHARLGGIHMGDFRKSLSGLRHDVYFVIEKIPRWYNGSYGRILGILRSELDRKDFARVVTLGVSMGGFGAFAFASQLARCIRAIAFAPQSSMKPDVVPFESRWAEIRNAITHWEVPDATDLSSSAIEYVMFVGRDEPLDILHADRFLGRAKRAIAFEIENCGHAVASTIKAGGILPALLDTLIESDDASEVCGILRRGKINALRCESASSASWSFASELSDHFPLMKNTR